MPALSVSPLFANHMVLQRDKPCTVWGDAPAGGEVRAFMDGVPVASAPVSSWGRFRLALPPSPSGGPHTLVLELPGGRLEFEDVWFGDVWICSGQSNMEWPLSQSANAEAEVARAGHRLVRFFQVARCSSFHPQESVQGKWQVSSPASAADFSAVAWHFAERVAVETGVPQGMVGAYWGGSTAEAWISPLDLAGDEEFAPLLERRQDLAFPLEAGALAGETRRRDRERLRLVRAVLDAPPRLPVHAALPGPLDGEADWFPFHVPGAWEERLGAHFDGVVWFRKEFEIPPEAPLGDWTLHLGVVDDFDDVWVNGVHVGAAGPEVPETWRKLRSYPLAPGLLRSGKNVLLVRVIDHGGAGGFVSPPWELAVAGPGARRIPLAGEWHCRVESRIVFPPWIEPKPLLHHTAGLLFDGMIAPLLALSICGVLWYQGESNAMRAAQYRRLFPHLIRSWRARWQQGDFPFYFVQLAAFGTRPGSAGPCDWAELREAQALALELPRTGMALALDVGDVEDIHPKNKRTVGERLALHALKDVHGRADLPASGPVFQCLMSEAGGRIRVRFEHDGGGLHTPGRNEVLGFEVADAEGRFAPVRAVVDGSDVVLTGPEGRSDVPCVRYAWADHPEVNLVNAAGLPAVPFRTDHHPLATAGKR